MLDEIYSTTSNIFITNIDMWGDYGNYICVYIHYMHIYVDDIHIYECMYVYTYIYF